MEERINLLNKNRSVSSVNKDLNIPIGLTNSQKSFSRNSVSDTMDIYDMYLKERDESRNYRLIFTVDILASNILYNRCSEFILNEGGEDQIELRQGDEDNLKVINQQLSPVNTTEVDWKQALRDTEYSREDAGALKYCYGLDIFNNHMLRSKDFIFVGKTSSTDSKSPKVFNTLSDYMRDEDGNILQVAKGYEAGTTDGHLYQMDSVYSMAEAVKNRLVEKNGWLGFYNPTNIKIPNYKDKSMNSLDGSAPGCSFIQMYPDSSLYSFVPKKNPKRRRIEKNWDYVLTYPYRNRFDVFNQINSCPDQINGIRILSCSQFEGENGKPMLLFRTKLRHNLAAGDFVSIYYSTRQTNNKIPTKLTVRRIGDKDGNDTEHYFAAEADRMAYLIDYFFSNVGRIDYSAGELVNTITGMYMKKVVDSCECRYYVREFRKLYLAAGRDSDYGSDIMKMSYAENIYSDDIAQLVFSDTVSVDGVKDNWGRDVSELAMVMVKSNRGYKEWYEEHDFGSEKVEYSHCFGKVTSGIDMPKTDLDDEYNVRMLYNVEIPKSDKDYYEASAAPKPLENDITIDKDSYFVDIVEYHDSDCSEVIFEKIYHRFNTMQRELPAGNSFDTVLDDEIIRDDYDFESGGFETEVQPVNVSGFTDNIALEGYYYEPAYKFKIRQISDNTVEYSGRRRNYEFTDEMFTEVVEEGVRKGVLTLDIAYSDKDIFAVFVNAVTQEKIFGYIKNGRIESGVDAIGKSLADCILVTTEYAIPADAAYNFVSRKFVARKVMDFSELGQANELSSMPFSNGCHYIEKNIRLYVRRQDPFGEYKLSSNSTEGITTVAENKFYTNFGRYGDRYDYDDEITVTKRDWTDCVSQPEISIGLSEMANVSGTITDLTMESLDNG